MKHIFIAFSVGLAMGLYPESVLALANDLVELTQGLLEFAMNKYSGGPTLPELNK